MLTGATALIIAALLLLLYWYRRRQYILHWTASWALVALSMLTTVPTYSHVKIAAAVYGFSQFLGIIGALMLVLSADAFRSRPRVPRRAYAMMLLPVLLWFVLAPLALEVTSVFAPGHIMIAGAQVAAAVAHFALLGQARLLGAAAIGMTMMGLAGASVWMALGVAGPNAPAAGAPMFVTLGLYLVAALGMQLMTFEDMTYELRLTNHRLEAAQSELRTLVTTDALTGCRNRRYFDEIIDHELARHRRYKLPLSMLFIDVDRFKTINDTLGHEAGDRVLQTVAAFLVQHVREADYVFRWGGDEFLILMSCTEAEASRKAMQLQTAFAVAAKSERLPRGVGLSVGSAAVPAATRDVMTIIKRADERMYAAKRRR